MPTFSADGSTPNYVLMDDGRRIGPRLTPVSSEKCNVIYGFSSKAAYECFRDNCDVALKPYPLVKGYLRKQIGEVNIEHLLVAIDVQGPLDPTLKATTIAAVLDAQEKQIAHVTSVYLLAFDEDEKAYRLAEVSATP